MLSCRGKEGFACLVILVLVVKQQPNSRLCPRIRPCRTLEPLPRFLALALVIKHFAVGIFRLEAAVRGGSFEIYLGIFGRLIHQILGVFILGVAKLFVHSHAQIAELIVRLFGKLSVAIGFVDEVGSDLNALVSRLAKPPFCVLHIVRLFKIISAEAIEQHGIITEFRVVREIIKIIFSLLQLGIIVINFSVGLCRRR